LLGATSSALASDHIDGVPSLELHEQVDLTDLYVFPTPDKKESLTTILNLYPGVGHHGHFSSKVSYRLHYRPVEKIEGHRIILNSDQEIIIKCSFTDPKHHHWGSRNHEDPGSVSCKTQRKDTNLSSEVAGFVGQILNSKTLELKIFSGSRSDPFFISREAFDMVTKREGFDSKAPGSVENLMEKLNVLTIAVELDLQSLFPNGGVPRAWAIAAESISEIDGQAKVLDRVGRPEITNLSLHDFSGDEGVKRAYNQTPAFEARKSEAYQSFKKRLNDNITAYDKFDEVTNWDIHSLHVVTETLLDDFLLIDLGGQCSADMNHYLAIEKAIWSGVKTDSCGGRHLKDDIMKTLFALYIGGLDAPIESYESGVSAPYQSSDKKLSDDFPYLANPERTGLGTFNAKRLLLNSIVKRMQE
jgi:hypothetical protein